MYFGFLTTANKYSLEYDISVLQREPQSRDSGATSIFIKCPHELSRELLAAALNPSPLEIADVTYK